MTAGNQNIILLKVVLSPESDMLDHVRVDPSDKAGSRVLVSSTIASLFAPTDSHRDYSRPSSAQEAADSTELEGVPPSHALHVISDHQ